MAFKARHDDVFMLSGPGAEFGPKLRGTEAGNPRVRAISLDYVSSSDVDATAHLIWNDLSQARRERGEQVDLTLTVERTGHTLPEDQLVIRLPVEVDSIWDPTFGVVFASALRTKPGSVRDGELSLLVNGRHHVRRTLANLAPGVMYQAAGWAFPVKPTQVELELRLHLTPELNHVRLDLARAFVGLDYDPYIYHPLYEFHAHNHGPPKLANADKVKALFMERAAQLASSLGLWGTQCMHHPFIVMREGTPRFPMLVGTPTSISWYATHPSHGIELFLKEGHVRAGDRILDCGAHAGQMATFFALTAGPQGRVHAFEPFPQNWMQLEAQRDLNELSNLTVTRAGIGETTVGRKAAAGGGAIPPSGPPEGVPAVEIDLVPIDDFLSERPTFIKLDIEGAEVSALRGAQKVLRDCRPRLFIEVHTPYLPKFGHALSDLFEAIPLDLYKVTVTAPGQTPCLYSPGMEQKWTDALLVTATPL